MLFNSLHFLIFFPIVLLIFFSVPIKYRWIILLVAAYYFYSSWQVPLPKGSKLFGEKIVNPILLVIFQARYTLLLFFLSVINYFLGLWIGNSREENKRKIYFISGITINVGLLFYFKYYNFFIFNLSDIIHLPKAEVILPLGISFFVFQKIAYLFEIYKYRFVPERNFWMFLVYCSFFPQLIAGPIERPQNLLPQLNNLKSFNYEEVVIGLRQILWGMFKKVVIADRLSYFTNVVYNNPGDYHGISIITATVFFTFQIYCDFSGYSDIALGTARIMGIHLMTNFRTPYFARSIQEFWSRWHISLSTWFRDYLYIPLGGNKVSIPRWIFNLIIVFLISGIWHGGNWTFVIWGLVHGIFNALEALNRKFNFFPFKTPIFIQRTYTLVVVIFAWVFFRANNVSDSIIIFKNMFHFNGLQEIKNLESFALLSFLLGFPLIFLLLTLEKLQQNERVCNYFIQNKYLRYSSYILMFILIASFGVFIDQASFIYFQF